MKRAPSKSYRYLKTTTVIITIVIGIRTDRCVRDSSPPIISVTLEQKAWTGPDMDFTEYHDW